MKYRKGIQLIHLICIAIFTSALIACGGGGGGGGGGTPQVTPEEGSNWDEMHWDKGKWK
ncbi:MAG: hypothetical protein OEY52_14025 [Gammaproteobacteria bacterium]|nr:hypothetical protein [Gammaproteobacteria bacterium]